MRFDVERDAFLGAAKFADAARSGRRNIPALDSLLIVAEAGLRVSGTCLDRSATASCTAAVPEPGASLPNADALVKWLSVMPAGSLISATGDDRHLSLSAGRAHITLPVLPAGDFPRVTDATGLTEVAGAAPAIATCAPFCAASEVRPYLQGVALNAGHAVATDGAALHAAPLAHDVDAIIPRDALPIIAAIKDARVFVGANMWRAEGDGVSASGKLIGDKFPDWRLLVGDTPALGTLFAPDAIAAIRSVSASGASRVIVDAKPGEMTFEADGFGATISGATSTIHYDGVAFVACFAVPPIMRALTACKDSTTTIGAPADRMKFSFSAPGVGLSLVLPMRSEIVAARILARVAA